MIFEVRVSHDIALYHVILNVVLVSEEISLIGVKKRYVYRLLVSQRR